MLRTRPVGERYIAGGKVAGIVVALAATGLLAACGGNDSTASSTPTLKPSHTTATVPAAQSAPNSAPAAPEPSPEQAPATSTANERPEPAQPTSAESAPLSAKDQAYLDELKKRGVNPSSPDIAITAANYVCQSKASGASDQEVKTFVNAMAGTDPSFDPQKMSVEQAGQIYIDVATQSYCNK
ncbi:DUF732 domain-containing protein [Nocardia cerradoensis]|uniref:DUF732 domain-containing protein n=1 Tax=Nocardia cerradoensis TaxID=85688 RepID=A0A231HD00_9NOCA|nr:DUF732 domain-containing protein [Nocardia cerradoensis]NKY47203.1 DUF732 domain-containing protein [Nocardia cerradoensis]OXR46577.1 hypothetical protein B7C42_01548 [Nocardia cerradoensis]